MATAQIVKSVDQTDDAWLVDLAGDFRRWGNLLTARRLERVSIALRQLVEAKQAENRVKYR